MTDLSSGSAVVEQAKGAIMLRYGVTSYESLAAMARWAREAHVSLEDVANAMVKGICQGRVTPETKGLVRWLEQRLRAGIAEAPAAAAAAPATELRRRTITERIEPRTARRSTDRAPAAATPAAPAAPASPAAGTSTAAAAAARQWRYSSAVHAARALRSP
jgi:hypothetical protein